MTDLEKLLRIINDDCESYDMITANKYSPLGLFRNKKKKKTGSRPITEVKLCRAG